jgi:uncharacterized protein (TIGR03086 family)
MPWNPDVAFLTGLDFFNGIVGSVGARDWQRSSPCTGWTALDVLGHIGIGTEFGTKLLRGEQPQWHPVDPPGESVSGDPAQWWAAKVGPAKDAVRGVDLAKEVDSPMGRRSISQGLSFPAVDLFVHGWDLARSIGRDVEIPYAAIEFAHQALDQIAAEQVRSPRVFAAEVRPTPDATATQRFVAWTGRDPRWVPA